ncbi:MAG: glycosyltransferase [Patescibacteria group bacterium]
MTLTTEHVSVTIVLPTYNRMKFLSEAITSVLSQSFLDFKLIIIDDGSTDESARLIQSFNDKRITYLYQENRGEYAATNVGLRKVQSKYFTWIHSDDIWPEDSLKLRVEWLQGHPDADLVHGDIAKIDEHGSVLATLQGTQLSSGEVLKTYCTEYYPALLQGVPPPFLTHHTTFLMRRPLLDVVGYFDESLPHAGDFDWMLRALHVSSITYLPKLLYLYRRHVGTKTVSDEKQHDTKAVVKEILDRHCPISVRL